MRTSCDVDILVEPQASERAAALLQEELGCRPFARTSHDISLVTPGQIHVELHHTLIEEADFRRADAVLASVWDYAVPVADGAVEYALRDDAFYYYHLAHMAIHLGGGCGVRPFLDLWILDRLPERDEAARAALLEKGGLTRFAEVCRALSGYWFGDGSGADALGQTQADVSDTTRELAEWVQRGGTFGTVENRVATQNAQTRGKFAYFWARIWLPYRTLSAIYPALRGKPLLLPFFEVRRWCRLLSPEARRRGVAEMKKLSGLSEAETADARDFLERIGLL